MYHFWHSTFGIQFYFTGKSKWKSTTNLSKTSHWKFIFVVWSYNTWARQHTRNVGTWACKHARNVDTWARKHARHVNTSVRKHPRDVGTWARKHARQVGCEHVSTQDKLTRENVSTVRHVGTTARKHDKAHKQATHVGTWACNVQNLTDSKLKYQKRSKFPLIVK